MNLSGRLRPGFSWLGLIGFGLLLALLGVALVQARQFQLLQQAVRSGDDFAVLSIYQVEIEYLRLRESWRRARESRTDLSPEDLKLRYDIWVSRVALLEGPRPRRLIAEVPSYLDTLFEVQRFIALADTTLGENPRAAVDASFLATRLPALYALGPGIHSLSLGAAHSLAEQNERRNLAVRQQNQ
ncbi:MAG: hybrid sensor histidine kinase/response regulator, partial [Rubrivivax sp.]|nr:hybrid sensor histidine kinase/response regulator [Rubrivivax sp.]